MIPNKVCIAINKTKFMPFMLVESISYFITGISYSSNQYAFHNEYGF
jgi:hypothetical protein